MAKNQERAAKQVEGNSRQPMEFCCPGDPIFLFVLANADAKRAILTLFDGAVSFRVPARVPGESL